MGTRRVLVADDEWLIACALARILESRRVEVTTVASAEDALDHVQSHCYDLCFLDRKLPGLDGLEALPFIKEASPATRVVFMTASEVTPAEQAVIRHHADFFLSKPFDVTEVKALAERMLADIGQDR